MATRLQSSHILSWVRGKAATRDFPVPDPHDARLTIVHKVPARYLTGVVNTVDEIIDRMVGKTE